MPKNAKKESMSNEGGMSITWQKSLIVVVVIFACLCLLAMIKYSFTLNEGEWYQPR